jgi:hypothetical protein
MQCLMVMNPCDAVVQSMLHLHVIASLFRDVI